MLRVDALATRACAGWGEGPAPLTRLVAGPHVVAEPVEWVAWRQRPLRLVLLGPGGVPEAHDGGWGEIVRCAGDVLILPPSDPDRRPVPALARTGGLHLPKAAFDATRPALVPPAARFPRATRRHLAGLWLRQARLGPDVSDLDALEHELRHRVLGARGVAVEVLLDALVAVRTWVEAAPDTPLRGRLVRLGASARVETLYVDGARPGVWHGLASVGGRLLPLLAPDRAYAPSAADRLGRLADTG